MKQRTMCNVLPLGQEMENIYVYIQIFLFVHKNLSSVSSVQSLSHVQLFATPWAAARQASLSITNSQSLLKLIHCIGDAIQPSHPLSSPSPAFNFSQHQGLFKWSVLLIKWPEYWSFSISISPFNEYSVLISFRMNWLDLLVVQGTLKSLLQHHSSKAEIFQHSAFFIVELSHPYMTTGKIIAFSMWKQWQTIFLGSKITADGVCHHEIKRHLLLGRKAMTNLDGMLKSRDITLLTKVHLVKAVVFSVVVYGCESWTPKKAEGWRIYVFELWCWRKTLENLLDCKEIQPVHPKGN